jgi:hypothetical protein
MNSKVKTDKQGEYDCIEEIKLRVYKLDVNVSSSRLLLAPFIGGQVSEFRSVVIQTQRLCRFTLYIPYSTPLSFGSYLGP